MSTEKTLYKDSFFNGIKNSVESSFITPYALFLQASSHQIALISSAPRLVASVFQLFTPHILSIFHTRKMVIVIATLLDALMYLPMMFIPLLWNNSITLLLNFLVIQAMAIAIIRPIYGGLIGDILPQNKRAAVLGHMNNLSSISIFVSALVIGFMLNSFADKIIAFGLVFGIALIARIFAAWYRLQLTDIGHISHERVNFHLFVKSLWKHNFGRFVLYNALIKVTTGMSAPFIVVYLLEYLKINFLMYALLLGAPVLSSYFIMQKYGRKIDLRGSKSVLNSTGYFIGIIPLMWLAVPFVPALFFVRMASGAVWSGFNLAMSTFVIDATTSRNRLSLTSYSHLFEGIALFVGASIGGFIMQYYGVSKIGFTILFSLVAVLRLIISIIFLPRLYDERYLHIKVNAPKATRIVSSSAQGLSYVYVPRKK